MQGLPTQLLTKMTATKAGKVDNSPLNNLLGNSEGEAAATPAANGEFASLFSGMVEGKDGKNISPEALLEGAQQKGEKPQGSGLDVLLNVKGQEQKKSAEVTPLTAETALSPEVLKNINNLIIKNAQESAVPANSQKVAVTDKVAKTSSNIEALLNNLKGTETPAAIEEGGEEWIPQNENGMQAQPKVKGEKAQNPLEFLIQKSKAPNVGMTTPTEVEGLPKEESKAILSKLGLGGEDFVKNTEVAKAPVAQEAFNPQQLIQKNMNQTMKAYGQKQNLLNDNVIKNTKDLASKDSKAKSTIDVLKTPDLKIGAQLSSIKEDFVPLMQKPDAGQQNLQTNVPQKVLDLSTVNMTNTNELIQKISDYVQQSQVANSDSIDLKVKHDSLGEFNIQVNKQHGAQNQAMDMQIVTSTAEGHEFFTKNEIGLLKNLSQAGIQLSDLRIVSGGSEGMSFSQNDNRQSGQSQYNGNAPREFMSFDSGNSSNGSERRRALWEQAQQNQQRYGA